METKIIEAHGNDFNWGKFLVARFDSEWSQPSAVDPRISSLIRARGWTHRHLLVLDIETGEAAIFMPGGYAKADLDKHAIWVCPLFEPFLTWLYQQDLSSLDALPAAVELPDAPAAMQGYRRPGLARQDGS